MWGDIIVGLLIAAMAAGAVIKIVSEKRKGSKCIGCPYSKDCSKRQGR
ncbi:MAG: FeoB-associated Cys-rich membrane protein [Eubacteriales bacterium]|jgi:hypothetical protein|nr:FeoB-associated Cys-rich membrane protein [Eubacteriales bacterium]MDD4716905.1 FeoB-associated Cys-rich membrane protein [Eubacteriales bacterium]